jgi:hypothetical protein
MYRPLLLAVVFLALPASLGSSFVRGAAIVFSNVTDKPVSFTVTAADGKQQTCRLAAGDVAPLPVLGKVGISFDAADGSRRYVLEPNTIGYFHRKQGLDLVQRSFAAPQDEKAASGEPAAGSTPVDPPEGAPRDAVLEVPVMLLVDDDEPAVREVWEAKFRQRIQEASDLFERYCRVRFKVVATGTWQSTNQITDFSLSLREFERAVKLQPPARLAIGFTSQYKRPETRRAHMGGTRGPLYPYILVREWSQHVSPSERLEVLVHELGHVLGASHSAEQNSVMRPVVGDGQSRAASFRIGFDPVNTLAMYLFCEDLRLRGGWSLGRVRPATRDVLSRIYKELDKELPGDESAQRYLAILDRVSRLTAAESSTASPGVAPAAGAPPAPSKPVAPPAPGRGNLAQAVRRVVEAVTSAARSNHQRQVDAAAGAKGVSAYSDDRLTEYYVRMAAATMSTEICPPEIASKAFLLGLAVAMEDSPELRDHKALGPILRSAESDEERRGRLAVLGRPTVRGRRDLAAHFFVSAALAAILDTDNAEAVGVAKELSDSRRPSGFSFVDLSADMAGAAFASRVLKGGLPLSDLVSGFTIEAYVSDGSDLEEGLSAKTFAERYGSTEDARFRETKEKIRGRILGLPGHAAAEKGDKGKD